MKIRESVAGAILVVLVAQEGCSIDNIDRSDHTSTYVETLSECEEKALKVDKARSLRAFCIDLGGQQ